MTYAIGALTLIAGIPAAAFVGVLAERTRRSRMCSPDAHLRNHVSAVRIEHQSIDVLEAKRFAQWLCAEIQVHRARAAEVEVGLAVPVELQELLPVIASDDALVA